MAMIVVLYTGQQWAGEKGVEKRRGGGCYREEMKMKEVARSAVENQNSYHFAQGYCLASMRAVQRDFRHTKLTCSRSRVFYVTEDFDEGFLIFHVHDRLFLHRFV